MTAFKPDKDSFVLDTVYESVIIPEQATVRLSYVAATDRYLPPDPVYLEPGCGNGVTLNLLAAACHRGR